MEKNTSPDKSAAAEVLKAVEDPLIKTVSQVELLSPEDKQKFRASGGTTIEDPT